MATKPAPQPAPQPRTQPSEPPQASPATDLGAKLLEARAALVRAREETTRAAAALQKARADHEGAVAGQRLARMRILDLVRDVGGSDVADNFLYVTDEQALAMRAKAAEGRVSLDAFVQKLLGG